MQMSSTMAPGQDVLTDTQACQSARSFATSLQHLLEDFDAVPFTDQLACSHQPGSACADHRLRAQRAARLLGMLRRKVSLVSGGRGWGAERP